LFFFIHSAVHVVHSVKFPLLWIHFSFIPPQYLYSHLFFRLTSAPSKNSFMFHIKFNFIYSNHSLHVYHISLHFRLKLPTVFSTLRTNKSRSTSQIATPNSHLPQLFYRCLNFAPRRGLQLQQTLAIAMLLFQPQHLPQQPPEQPPPPPHSSRPNWAQPTLNHPQ